MEKAKTMKLKIDQIKQVNEGRLWVKAKKDMENFIKAAERDSRELGRCWIHMDMDMFYAAVEIRDNPKLAKVPLAIGSDSMISTANYEARKYGVRSAMPGFIARKLCPNLVFIPCNFQKYREASIKFKEVIERYDPDFETMGLDECNMDVTQYCFENGIESD